MSSAQENVNDIDNVDETTFRNKAVNFRTEMLKGVHSPSDVLSPFSQKISSERNSALKNFKPKSLMDMLLNSQQLGAANTKNENNGKAAEQQSLKSTLNQIETQEYEEVEEEEEEVEIVHNEQNELDLNDHDENDQIKHHELDQ